jgi:integrase
MMPVGRCRKTDLDLPPRMRRKGGAFYFDGYGKPRKWIPLGSDRAVAMAEWARLYAPSSSSAPAPAGTFEAIAERYRREVLPGKAPKTRQEQDKQLTALVGVFGAMRAADIEPQHVRQYLDARTAKVAANREKALLSHVLTKAREWGVMAGANPCAGIRGFTERARSRYVNDDELRAILAKADAPLAAILRLAYLTAQRPADVLKLRRSDVRDGFLHVEQNKTGAKLRIALEGELASVVSALTALPARSLFLVHGSKGRPITAASLRTRFERAREAAGVDFQFRDLRAKAGTDAGNLADAQALLGHAAATTTDRYIRRRVGVVVRPVGRKL